MLKRVQLGPAFLDEPEVIFLDEPTAGLDPDNARKIRELIAHLRKERTIVVSSHNLREIQELCDAVTILDHGRVVGQGSMDEVTASGRLVRIRLSGPLPDEAETALGALDVVDHVRRTGEIEFVIEFETLESGAMDGAMRQVYETLASHDLYPRRVEEGASLESRFLELTRAHGRPGQLIENSARPTPPARQGGG